MWSGWACNQFHIEQQWHATLLFFILLYERVSVFISWASQYTFFQKLDVILHSIPIVLKGI